MSAKRRRADPAFAIDEPLLPAVAPNGVSPLRAAVDACADLMRQLAGSRERLAEEQKSASQRRAGLILDMLDILDGMERLVGIARSAQQDDQSREIGNFMASLHRIGRKMEQTLRQYGLEEIPASGLPLNPEVHEVEEWRAVEPNAEPGIVVEVVRRGFFLEGKLLRPALVVVTRHDAAECHPPEMEV